MLHIIWKDNLLDEQLKTIHRLIQRESESIDFEHKLMGTLLEKDREILRLKSLLEIYKNGVMYE